jgi:outer membrane immunogenic protein
MKRFLIVGAFALLAGEQALAADLPPPVAPRAPAVYVPAPVPYYSWTGFYIGGNLGVAWQQGSLGDQFGNNFPTSNSIKGLGGGQVGANYQFSGGVVVGVEAMFDWRFNNNNTSNTTLVAPPALAGLPAAITVNDQWLTTVTGRLGYAWDRTLVYAKGGGAWVGSSNPTLSIGNVSQTISTSTSNWGWTVGAGIEYAFWGTWSARVEYDYIGLTNQTFTCAACATGDQFTFNNRNINMVTAGINYKFGGW